MKAKPRYLGFIAVWFLATALILAPGFTPPAQASGEDVAMFYDDLGQMGQWFEYENYGAVWHPSNVGEDWRPYTDGRWVPTNDGYVFESQEPWGWATYHYGNWMPTAGYGWVWVPGRTWYPSTVDWRTSPEDAPVETSYVGWAPIPPPDYVPPPAYAPASGYYPGAPVGDSLSSPLWIFARAASFLLGLGQPYTPAYSYGGCGCLAPPTYVPTFFPQTVIVPNYYTPNYYGPGIIGAGLIGAYNWGPPVGYVSRVTNINQTVINNTIINNTNNIGRIHNVRPPDSVISRNPHIRDITPANLVHGKPLPPSNRVTNIRMAQANLNKPNIVRTPQGVTPIKANIPRVTPVAHQPGQGIPGAGLPTRATQQLTPQMQQRIKQLPPQQQVMPTKPLPIKPALTAGGAQPGATGKPGQVQPGVTGRPGQVQPGITGKPGELKPGQPGYKPPTTGPGFVQPGTTGKPGQVQPGVQPGATGKPGQVQPGVTGKPGELKPGQPGYKPPTTGPGFVQPGTTGRPGQAQPGVTGKPGQVQPGVAPHTGAVQPGVAKPGATPAVPGKPGPAQPAVPPKGRPEVTGRPGPGQPGVTGRPGQAPSGTAHPGEFRPSTGRPGEVKPATPTRPQPQAQPQRVQPTQQPKPQPPPARMQPPPQQQSRPQPQAQPQRVQPQPQPRPQPQPQVRPQPQPQPRPQPQAQPRPQPQAQPKPQPQPQAQPQKQQDNKKKPPEQH